MAGGLRIKGLIDIVRSRDPREIGGLAGDVKLDRRFEPKGPLLNRLIAGNLRAVLSAAGKPLPTVTPWGHAERAQAQTRLREKLDAVAATPFDAASIAPLVRAVRGADGAPPLELAVQEAIGRCFAADYQATPESWGAAKFLDGAARTPNPVALLLWGATGKLERMRGALAAKVNGSPAGVHATGLAVHTMLRGFEAMRDLLGDRQRVSRMTVEAALAQCLGAPKVALRQATAAGETIAGEVREGTLVLLELDAARLRDPGPEMTFMAGSWAECPASRWAPALLRAVWLRAVEPEPAKAST